MYISLYTVVDIYIHLCLYLLIYFKYLLFVQTIQQNTLILAASRYALLYYSNL